MTLEDAKKFFISMNCVMERENLPLFEEYKRMGISKSLEMKWREERFNEIFTNLKYDAIDMPFWKSFDQMADLTTSLKKPKYLKLMKESLKIIIDKKLSLIESLTIAETIIGRLDISQRSGLIFLSIDLGDEDLAHLFIIEVLYLVDIESKDVNIIERVKRAKEICLKIKDELKL